VSERSESTDEHRSFVLMRTPEAGSVTERSESTDKHRSFVLMRTPEAGS
jgi:hypothetical protein